MSIKKSYLDLVYKEAPENGEGGDTGGGAGSGSGGVTTVTHYPIQEFGWIISQEIDLIRRNKGFTHDDAVSYFNKHYNYSFYSDAGETFAGLISGKGVYIETELPYEDLQRSKQENVNI